MGRGIQKIGFIWQGISDPQVFKSWDDGLSLAIQRLKERYNITFYEPTDDFSKEDVLLYWEAPCTYQGKNADKYRRVQESNVPSILLFAGGPIKDEWIEGFDRIVVESAINEDELVRMGITPFRAFGVNEKIFKPLNQNKQYEAFFHATFADWKRHRLFADTYGSKGVVAGRLQEHDRDGYNKCRERGVTVLGEMSREEIAKLLNMSWVCTNTSSYWGGGQRTTLEAMACGTPVVVMKDSPKNCEFVQFSGGGEVADPEPEKIWAAHMKVLEDYQNKQQLAYQYVQDNWTSAHYAESLAKVIKSL